MKVPTTEWLSFNDTWWPIQVAISNEKSFMIDLVTPLRSAPISTAASNFKFVSLPVRTLKFTNNLSSENTVTISINDLHLTIREIITQLVRSRQLPHLSKSPVFPENSKPLKLFERPGPVCFLHNTVLFTHLLPASAIYTSTGRETVIELLESLKHHFLFGQPVNPSF